MNINETSKGALLGEFKSYYDNKSIVPNILKIEYNFAEGAIDDLISVNIGDTLTFVEEDKITHKIMNEVCSLFFLCV
jgi:plastocyanin